MGKNPHSHTTTTQLNCSCIGDELYFSGPLKCALRDVDRPARYSGDDISDTLAAVLRDEPKWVALPADLSPTLRTYLERCLEKDVKRRVRDIGDVRLAMEGAFDTGSATEDPKPLPAIGMTAAATALVHSSGIERTQPAATPGADVVNCEIALLDAFPQVASHAVVCPRFADQILFARAL